MQRVVFDPLKTNVVFHLLILGYQFSTMVRTYKRTSSRQSWNETSMQSALHDIAKGKMGILKASKIYGLPITTLRRRARNKNKFATGSKKCLGGHRSTFSIELESELQKYLITMETMFFGLTRKDLQCLAYQLAEQNDLKHNFSHSKKAAGVDWLNGFLSRHTSLSIRSPEATSIARAMAFNKVNVGAFFDLLEKVQDEKKLPASRVFNVDETGLTTVQGTPSKVIALKGRRQVGSITSAERGQLCTAVICMSASGVFIPPMIIFPRVRMKLELMDGTPPDTIYACHKSGWMQMEIFQQWFGHFLVHTHSTIDNPSLLILDGHATHTNNLEVIQLARAQGVTLLCLPPHCSHKLQPLDVSFMRPLSTFYDQECEKWLRQHPGRVITMFQLGSIFGSAYMRAATPLVAQNGYRRTGIFPVNRDVFAEHEFAPATVTDNADDNTAQVQHPVCATIPPQDLAVETTESQPPVSETTELRHLAIATESQDPVVEANEPQHPVVVTIEWTCGKYSVILIVNLVYCNCC